MNTAFMCMAMATYFEACSKRRGFLSQLPKDYFKLAVVFETPDEIEHYRRLHSREGKFIPPMVIDDMTKLVAKNPVTLEEGWDLINMVPA